MVAPAIPRRVALDVLDRVLGQGLPFDDVFAGHPRLGELAARDRAFARLLVTTTLRRLGQIDDLVTAFVPRRPDSVRVHNLLRMGIAQLLFLGTPPHAAVGETVALARGRESFARGLVNAVLRRAAREGQGQVEAQDAARLNLPPWLWRSWCATYGEATVREIAEVQVGEPPLDLTLKEPEAPLPAGLDGRRVTHWCVRLRAAGPIEQLPGFADGGFWVQDVAAGLPACLLGEIGGREVVDLCAAPGGKTAQLAAAGARVTAVESAERRALRLRENLARLRLAADVVVADARTWRPLAPAPCVLLDAPCTATGTIRRHPDVTWHKTPAEVARMAHLQGRLLDAAMAMLAPGGVLVYASCSLQPEEGPQVIEAALARAPSLAREPIRPAEVDGLPVLIGERGEVRTLPCHLAAAGGMDGFFIARLRRR